MKLINFSTNIFAGISNIDVFFEEGLNVMLGPNESGKSTIVNAIFALLFIEPKLDLRSDKVFKDKFFPYPEGDYIEGELEFELNEGRYKISKRWSRSNPLADLKLPNDIRLSNLEKIKDKRQEIFPYGKSTYENIVFTRQDEVKEFLEKITKEDELMEFKGAVNNFLRRAVMELDGVSIDSLRTKISQELDDLIGKWDLEEGRSTDPERNFKNPFKRETGKIYNSDIKRQELQDKIKRAEEKENKYFDINDEVEKLKKNKEELEKRAKELSDIEDDIRKREKLERDIGDIDKELEEIKEINKNWPVEADNIEKIREELKKVEDNLENLNKEKERAKKLEEKARLAEEAENIAELEANIGELKKTKDKLGEINKEVVEELDGYKNKVDEARASLKAGKLTAQINYSSDDEITIFPGVEEKRSIDPETKVQADGYIRIKTEHIDVEVESAEIDFTQIQEEFENAENNYNELLAELEVESVKEAREKLNEAKDIDNKINNKQDKIEDILDGRDYQEIEEKIKELSDLEEAREVEKIEEDIDSGKDKIRDLEKDIEIKEKKIEEWQEKYESHDNLTDRMAELNSEKDTCLEKLKELAVLPDEFETYDEYRQELKSAREELDKLKDELQDKVIEMHEAKNELFDTTAEELEDELEQVKNEFNRLVNRAKKLKKLKKVFNQKLNEMDKNSFKPLIDTFSGYINRLTAGRYETASFDENFRRVELKQKDGKKLPADADKLSYGTFDGTALALRFALFENLFSGKDAFIVLDDCLVNLDPERRDEAIDLINEFGDSYQIIYTTCDPQTAKNLGGNLIKL